MPNLSEFERNSFIEIAEDTFYETCTIRHGTQVKDEYKQVSYTYVDEEEIPCGFMVSSAALKSEVGQAVVLQADGVLRLSLDQDISVDDLVVVRGKTYSVDGIDPGQTVKIVQLKAFDLNE